MNSDPIDEIKSRLNIIDVLSDYIQMKKAGVNYKANCPFHKEKTASFMVSPVKQIWHCFGCGLGGDIFEFIKVIENVEFSQALRSLADRAGVELKKPTVAEIELHDKKGLLIEINENAAVYYQKILWESKAAAEALKYLKDRGLSNETIKHWGLGFAPDDFHYLENFLAKKYSRPDIEAAGLIIKRDSRRPGESGYFDRFHGRIMFPIKSFHGDVVGFTGRLLKEQENTGKYVNSPETQIYNKSEVIYGLYSGKNAIRKENRAILVEGQMDVISCHQAGFTNAVASSGTAITVQQLSILQRLCENLYFAFDSDAAGTNATKRALETALSLGFSVKIIKLAPAKDPDELIKKGIGIWQKAVDSAPHFVEYFYEQLFKTNDPNSVDGKREISKELIPLISRIPDSITKAHFVRKLSTGLNVSEQAVWDMLKKVHLPKLVQKDPAQLVKKDRRVSLEEQILGLSLMTSTKKVLEGFEPDDFSEDNRELLRAFLTQDRMDIESLKSKFTNLGTRLDLLTFSTQVEVEQRGLDADLELTNAALELKRLLLKHKMEELTAKMSSAEAKGDKALIKVLAEQFARLSEELSKIPQ
ncbi:MAG: DNA primase [Acidobacteriaceae bacterium]